jgi:mannosyl-3-phosphoglycerate phosphatase family protein
VTGSHSPASPPFVVFTDLDGTLLDHHDYSWSAARPALERLRRLGIPLVLASSKTRSEMVALRNELGLGDPFVVENGAAIYLPQGYFDDAGSETGNGGRRLASSEGEALEVEILGQGRSEMLDTLHRLRRELGLRFEGFADFGVEGIIRHTDLAPEAARAAAERDGTEPILWLDDASPDRLAEALEPHGLQLVRGGRFFHVMGPVDKGRAVRTLLTHWRRLHPDIRAIALGDSDNDTEMLRAVDFPVVIPRAQGGPLDPGPLPNLLRPEAPGPEGWCWAIERLLEQRLADDPSAED